MRLAQIQMAVTADKAENLRHAEALLASVKGADMAVLPEMFCCCLLYTSPSPRDRG